MTCALRAPEMLNATLITSNLNKNDQIAALHLGFATSRPHSLCQPLNQGVRHRKAWKPRRRRTFDKPRQVEWDVQARRRSAQLAGDVEIGYRALDLVRVHVLVVVIIRMLPWFEEGEAVYVRDCGFVRRWRCSRVIWAGDVQGCALC